MTAVRWQAGLTDESCAKIDRYLQLLARAMPDGYLGVYLSGSAALGDWQPGRSDLDIVTVTARQPGPDALDALSALHASQAGRPYLDAAYVPAGVLGQRPEPGSAGIPHVIDGEFRRDGHQVEPVLLATLDRHAITVSGPEAATLGAAPDPTWLRNWNLGNLNSYWHDWSRNGRSRFAGRDPGSELAAAVATWVLLGPGRLHCTIATGDIISKTAAAGYTAQRFPAYRELLERARRWRLGDESVRFTVAEGLAACDLTEEIADDAAAAVAAHP
jgi:Domain of unknown function (DUF4111)